MDVVIDGFFVTMALLAMPWVGWLLDTAWLRRSRPVINLVVNIASAPPPVAPPTPARRHPPEPVASSCGRPQDDRPRPAPTLDPPAQEDDRPPVGGAKDISLLRSASFEEAPRGASWHYPVMIDLPFPIVGPPEDRCLLCMLTCGPSFWMMRDDEGRPIAKMCSRCWAVREPGSRQEPGRN